MPRNKSEKHPEREALFRYADAINAWLEGRGDEATLDALWSELSELTQSELESRFDSDTKYAERYMCPHAHSMLYIKSTYATQSK